MGNITRTILLLLVIVSIFVVATEGHRKRHNRRCPSRDDKDHVCCERKAKSYQILLQQCTACTAPTPENELCWHSRRRQQYFCWHTYAVNVTKVECDAKCCDGWTIDEHGQCSVRANEQEDIVCENGGSPAGDYCSCPIGFVGTHCETAVCTPICLNNGLCGGRDGKAVCICPERNFTGEQCEISVCDPKCQNGGSCMENGFETKCACMPGFTGQSCEKKIKDGECPVMSGISTCQVECGDDFQCPGTQKCCINGCGGGVCTYPENTTCTYNDQQYPVGSITNLSPCKMCYCFDPNSQGDKQWRCAVMDCPRLTCEHRKTMPDVCCPVCDDVPTTIRRATRTSRIPTARFPTTRTSRIPTARFPTTRTSRIPTARFPTTPISRIPTARFPTKRISRIPTARFPTTRTSRIPTKRFPTTRISRIPTTRTSRIPTARFPTTRISRIPTTRFPTTRISRIPTARFPTTRISRIPTARFPTTRTSRIPTARFPTTRTSRIPTARFPTTPISRIPTARFPTIRISRIPTTRFPTTRTSRIPTARFPTTRISRIPTARFPTTRTSRIPTARFPTTRTSRIPTKRFPTTRISRIPTTRTSRIPTARFPTTRISRIPTTRFPTTRISRIPTARFPTTRISRIPTARFPTTRTSRIPTARFPTTRTSRIPTARFPTTPISRIPTARFPTIRISRIPTTRFPTTRTSRIPTARFPTTRISRIPTARFPTTRTSRIPTARFPTTRTSRIPTARFPTTPISRIPTGSIDLDWSCMFTDCIEYPHCEKIRHIPGQCCPVCDEPPTTPVTTPEITTILQGCYFNGIYYPEKAEIQRSDCGSCMCLIKYDEHMNMNWEWECMKVDCFSPPCYDPVTPPVCPGTSSTTTPRPVQTTLSPDNAPYFKHCPKERLILSTLGRNYVDIRVEVNLTVVDKSGKKYAVRYSETLISAKPCNCTENYHIIIARSEVDKHGRFASCIFNVHVFDNNPPVYKTCPTSIAGFEDEIITWDIPEAYDNVAIKSEKFKSLHENNSKFKVGSHVVMYILTDDQRNIGICNFLVAIYERGTTDPTAPLELKNGDEKDKSVLINVVIGALTGLIVLTTIALVLACYYRRRRNQHLTSGNGHPVSGFDNGMYTSLIPPPSYGRSFGAKLSPKSMVRDEKLPLGEVDVKALSQKKGVQNPICDSTDDLDRGRRMQPKLEMREDTNA